MYRLNKTLADILNPKPDGFPLLTFLHFICAMLHKKMEIKLQFVADLLNINPIVTFPINPPLLN